LIEKPLTKKTPKTLPQQQVPPAYAPAGSPPSEQSSLFQKWIYLTQVYQAATYDAASTYWRRIKTDPDAQTMGVLYW